MRPTLLLRSIAGGGFWKRSLDELKRSTNRAIKFEAVTDTFSDLVLHQFRTPADILACKVFSDADLDGFSTADLLLVDPTAPPPAPTPDSPHPEPPLHSPNDPPHPYALFRGNIDITLPPSRPDVHRSGYAAWRTLERGYTLFGRALWDIDPYTYLALRVKSDGGRYYVNLQTDGIVPSDIHQHRLTAERIGEWEDVYIPFHEFVRTNYGVPVEPQDLLRSKVRTVGIGLIDRIPGPFSLAIDTIWATDRIRTEEKKAPKKTTSEKDDEVD
ncbi:complex I intermediate-associated protein 30-domain-containing protein [Kalaharituber pfeilii]|nr:complex I intermediate-associated protein 30-domain-containing protein [Kalaharituber pfeilii]